jgi:hypothetical protein
MTWKNGGSPKTLMVSLLCVDDDLQSFSRRLASQVNQSRMFLASVLATGTQVYPFRVDSIRGTASRLECTFRMRNTGSAITDADANDTLSRIEGCQILEARLVDESGVDIGSPLRLQVAS